MNQELYQYAISYKNNPKRAAKIAWIIFKYVILSLFSIPVFIHNKWHFVILVVSYLLSMLYNSRETDGYAKILFDIGITLVVVEIGFIYINLFYGFNLIFFPLYSIIGLAIYEILVLIKIKLKKYSTTQYSTPLEKPKTNWLAGGAALLGLRIGNILFEDISLAILVLLPCCYIAFFAFAISYFQKYVIYKILKKKYPEVFAKTA